MTAAIQEGPVLGSALFVSTRRPAKRLRAATPAPKERVRSRRRAIGLGPRTILVTNPACKATPRAVSTQRVARRPARRMPLYAGLLGSVLFSAAAFGLAFAVDTPRTLMSRGDYLHARHAIEMQARSETGVCRSLEPASRDVCRAEARAGERVRKAELDAHYLGTVAASAEVQVVRARVQFDVAHARCNTMDAPARLQCLQFARVEKSKAMAAAHPPRAT